MTQNLLHNLRKRKANGQKSFAVLIDPDKVNSEKLSKLLDLCIEYNVDYIFVGGSLIMDYVMGEVIAKVKEYQYSSNFIPKQ